MANDVASGGLNQLEDHYKSFIVRSVPVLLSLPAFILIGVCTDRARLR